MKSFEIEEGRLGVGKEGLRHYLGGQLFLGKITHPDPPLKILKHQNKHLNMC